MQVHRKQLVDVLTNVLKTYSHRESRKDQELMAFQERLFIEAIAHIFRQAGYEVQEEYRDGDTVFDLVAKDEEKTLAIEIKYITQPIVNTLSMIKRSIDRLIYNAKTLEMIPVLVISKQLDSEIRYQEENGHNLIILDASNLLYIARNDQNTYNKVVSILPGAIDGIEPLEPNSTLNLSWMEQGEEFGCVFKAFEICPAGKEGAEEFERICFEALQLAFSDDLTLWRKQKKSNSGLYRFDLVCRIKDDIQKTFWKILERFFSTKYIVFEFKNYSDEITQEQVYTTEKYLYTKALRTVGIIITANGADENAKKAAKGVLRETGKLILLLDKNDLIQMCKRKQEDDDPSNFLMDKLDELLFELEK